MPASMKINVVCDKSSIHATVDATQFEQVLLNLCTNAWYATEGRAGRIDIELDEVMLDAPAAGKIPGLQAGSHARIRVSDNGKGMDPAVMTRIFEPFFTTKPVVEGTGLGLSVVHGIVKSHHGAITVTSTPGKGATFCLYFRSAGETAITNGLQHAGMTSGEGTAGGDGKHLAYIDDDETLRYLITQMLQKSGYRVSGFDSAEAALAQCAPYRKISIWL